MPNLVGIGLSQVPTNSMLGGLAYQDPEHASIKNLDLKNLSQINSEIADTAVDVFVYDTSKDSDGGAWRKRTQYTSWYNETLGTATRGTRKEFPAVAVIVVESNSSGTEGVTTDFTIYDGDDPDLPMWMEYRFLIGSGVNTSITALNGKIVLTRTNNGILISDFISDTLRIHNHVHRHTYSKIYPYRLGRTAYGSPDVENGVTGYSIANEAVNDVAMTVLPNAPIDSATGLPVPTIAVATVGGVSVITDDGTVADITGFNPVDTIHIDGNNIIASTSSSGGNDFIFKTRIPASDEVFTTGIIAGTKNYYMNSNAGTTPLLRDIDCTHTEYDSKNQISYRGGNGGIDIIAPGEAVSSSSSKVNIAYITTSYNTGYMHGNIKGAFLSDTDTTNVTGSEKIANYNFAADFSTQWEAQNNANTSYDAANDRVTVTSTQNYSGIKLKNASLPTLTEGKRYIMTVDVHSITNPIRFGVVSGGTKDSVNSTGAHTLVFTAGASISEVFVQKPSGSNSTFVLNSVSIREAELDRSINNNGLQVFGTITKTAVATGAELVAYGPFSASNYLFQPYNSDLDFGTGDFSVTFWIKTTGQGYAFWRNDTTGSPFWDVWVQATTNIRFRIGFDSINATGNFTQWSQVSFTRSGGTVNIYINGDLNVSTTNTDNITNSDAPIYIGRRFGSTSELTAGYLSLMRISGSAPSAEQVKKIYEDEKFLFQENAKATLYGSSDAVTALAYDEVTDLLHVGISSGRSDFQGLRRINNTTTAVTTAISAHDEFIIEQ